MPRFAFQARHQRRQLQDDFFPVAQHQGVKEGRHRLGVETGGAAADDHRVGVVAVRGQQGHPAQVQHVQEVGVAQLVLETHPQQVKAAEGGAGLQAGQRLAPVPQVRLQVRGRGVGPLGPDVLLPVQNTVEQPQPQVGHAHFVEIGEEQGYPQGHGPGVFKDRVDLPAQVAAGALDAVEKVMVIGTGHMYLLGLRPDTNHTEATRRVPHRAILSPPFLKGDLGGLSDGYLIPPAPL